MIGVYKIMPGAEKVDRKNFFTLSHNTGARGHVIQLLSCPFKTDKRRRFSNEHVEVTAIGWGDGR